MGFNLHSVSASYDTYLPVIRGGLGIFFADNYMGGIINDNSGGFAWSYHLRAGKDIFVNAGLGASFIHRGINNGNIILPDQIDPLSGVVRPSSETGTFTGKTVFDIATGVSVTTRWFTGAIAVTHLTRPDLTEDENADGRISTGLNADFFSSVSLNQQNTIRLRPVITGEFQSGYFITGGGAAIETSAFSINSMIYAASQGDINFNAGVSVFPGRIAIFYNYCINIASGNKMLPASLYHHAGISISLNNVDKRKVMSTINFPKL
jgi:hypothetical protein